MELVHEDRLEWTQRGRQHQIRDQGKDNHCRHGGVMAGQRTARRPQWRLDHSGGFGAQLGTSLLVPNLHPAQASQLNYRAYIHEWGEIATKRPPADRTMPRPLAGASIEPISG
ncbi:hypothetical protein Afe04nite_59830 [Asanoa ferruginea]|nr:hypothetical protein Afe04nite_59830 [Asanoa ferruginea]